MHQALGHTLPVFAHIPFVTAPGTTKKLSKREIKKYRENPKFRKMFEDADQVFPQIGLGNSETLNPVMVEYYEKIGFLPHAVFNSLARLGWSLDDRTEFMTLRDDRRELHARSDREEPRRPRSRQALQLSDALDGATDARGENRSRAALSHRGQTGPGAARRARARVPGRVVQTLGERLKVFSDILEARDFFVADEAVRIR